MLHLFNHRYTLTFHTALALIVCGGAVCPPFARAQEYSTEQADTEFDAALPAFYYARVIEIPTPRWTAYEAKRFGVEMPEEVPMITTERAYTSPIWYSPM